MPRPEWKIGVRGENAWGVSIRRTRRGRRLEVESLEGRTLLSLSVGFANAIGVVGNGSVDVESNAVTNDAAGQVYLTGSLQGTADFDPGPGVFNLTSAGGRDVFLAKYAKTGALVWARSLRGLDARSVAQGAAVTVDASGNIVIGGTFTGTVDFDPGVGDTSLSAPSRNDAFIARYDKDGNFLWARAVTGATGNVNQTYALATDAAGNVAAAGSFQGATNFGATRLTAVGAFEGFVTRLDANGQFVWSRATAGSGTSVAQTTGLAFDPSGKLVESGFFAGTVDFDPSANVRNLVSNGSRDIYIRKLDAAGDLQWAFGVGAEDIDQGNSIAVDGSGNVYVTGMFSNAVDFDPGQGSSILTSGGFMNPFLLKLNSAGQYVWAKGLVIAGFSAGQGTGVGVDSSGRVFVAGYFQGVMTVDSGVTLTSAGAFDIFVGGYQSDGRYITGASYGGENFDAEFGVGVNGSGQVALAGRYSGPASFGSTTLPAMPNKSIFVARLSPDAPVDPPPAPGGLTLQASSDSGFSPTDRITRITSLTFDVSGIASGSHRVDLLRDGVVVASRLGAGPITDPGPLTAGNRSYSVRQTDSLGQTGPATAPLVVTIDTTPPTTPGLPTLLGQDDSGIPGDGVTSVRLPRLTGTVEAFSLVEILNPVGNVVASTTAGSGGAYTLAPSTTPLSDGSYSWRVRATDAAGNVSAPSPSLTLLIDGNPPPIPAPPTLLPADDTGVPGDNVTSVRQPGLTGLVEASTTVQLLNASGAVIGSTIAGSNGGYTVSPSTPLSEGAVGLRVRAIDAAGNLSAASGSLSLTIDATPPAAPAAPALLAADDSGNLGDGQTVRQPRLTGVAEPFATIALLDPSGKLLGSGASNASGSYVITLANSLADGTYSIRARGTDIAGNVGSVGPAFALTITTPIVIPASPSAPLLLTTDDSGITGDGVTRVRQPRLVGTAGVGLTVQILDGAGNLVGSAATAADGTYRVTLESPLADGAYALRARTRDVSGNLSALSASYSLIIDATAPSIPLAPTLLPADDSGVAGDGRTVNRRPKFTGQTEAASTVELLDGSGTILGSASASQIGQYVIATLTDLPINTSTMTVRVRDAAGNLSQSSPVATIQVITIPAGDYDGDGLSDLAVFRPTTMQWFARPSAGQGPLATTFGGPNLMDLPVTGDFDGDGKADIAVFRPSTAQWFVMGPTGGRLLGTFGATNLFDIPAPGDYDGDGKTDLAVFRPSTAQWFVMGPTGGRLLGTFGGTNLFDIPAPGDYDGDGKTDLAVFRPSTAQWFVMGPTGGRLLGTFGATNLFDIPAPGDYDGDGKAEPAVFRVSTAQWFAKGSTGGRLLGAFGGSHYFDLPAQTSVGALSRLGVFGTTRSASRTVAPSTASLVVLPPSEASSELVTPTLFQRLPRKASRLRTD